MCLMKNGFFTPWLQPGELRQLKTKGLQQLKGLNAKAAKDTKKINHRSFLRNPNGKSAGEKRMNALQRDLNVEFVVHPCLRFPY